MKIEKLEFVAIDVNNLNEAVKLWSDILGTTFIDLSDVRDERAIVEGESRTFEETKRRCAIDRTGFIELIESTPPVEKEGLRTIVFKVSNLEQAKAEMQQKGIHIAADVQFAGAKEAIFNAADLNGVRLCFVDYDTPTFVDAMQQK